MERGREEAAGEVLYEIRHHAKGTFAPGSSHTAIPASKDSTGGLLSYLSIPGVSRIKERWSGYNRQGRPTKRMVMFASPDGEHVAVAAGNQIVILQKGDDYMEPCGVYICNDKQSVFISGAWSEPHGIFGVVDQLGTLYFIKSNGEEISRRTWRQLKLSSSIIDLIVHDGINQKKSCLCGFCIFTSEGLLYHVEVSQEPTASINLIPTSTNYLKEKIQLPHDVSCLDYNSDLSLVVLVGNSSVSTTSEGCTGLFSLYLLRVTSSSLLELMFYSPHFDGLYSIRKGSTSSLAYPKVEISPQGKYVATLDMAGCISIFNLDAKKYSLCPLSSAESQYPHESDNLISAKIRNFNGIIDFSWWTDHILILAKGTGSITMYDILSGVEVIKKGPVYFIPVIERVEHLQEYVFVLEGTLSGEKSPMLQHVEDRDVQHSGHAITSVNNSQLDTRKLYWSLMSFSGRSVSEMYSILISNQQYQDALEFSNRHMLDRDDVLKAQWLHSDQGIHEINTLLSEIKDKMFVLSECADKVGPSEDAVKTLLSYGLHMTDQYKFSELDDEESSSIWKFRILRLKFLQYKDRLETFVGINMGRFSAEEYRKFRIVPLAETAVTLAESGKIGSLNLLFKRHPYSLSPSTLDILSAIPETVPVQTYGQLFPGRSPPSAIVLRAEDWTECEKMVSFISKLRSKYDKGLLTENMLKLSIGFIWPSTTELSDWYKSRAREIDILSGQLDNCLSLVEFACRKGLAELQDFLEDISYLHQLIYSDEHEEDFSMNLISWEQLSDYEKFRVLLKGVKVDTVVESLRRKAIPFMQNRVFSESLYTINQTRGDKFVLCTESDSFLVRWLKEMSAGNKLDICLAVIENACGDSPIDGLFKDETEIIETSLECIYSCTLTDQWNIMASILSKLPKKRLTDKSGEDSNWRHGTHGFGTSTFPYLNNQIPKSEGLLYEGDPLLQHSQEFGDSLGSYFDKLEKRIKVAEGHVDVGRLLAFYQVPKPINFFLGAQSDERSVKQLLRLILSKFGRRQPGRSDNDWANMWRDMQCFQEKAFPFLDREHMLVEFCRGLLKAGKFSLARNYLKGTSTVALSTEKAESLVIQASKEYFFSASSLDCTEIWKARECLNIFPNSKNVQSEVDVIDVLTIRLPNLGVTLLPMEFRQIRNPMEIINMVIASQTGAYLDIEELIEIAKLLGLSSQDDIAAVEEAVAREAAVAGDMQLAFDLCLVLAKKGHGPIWDLCAAIARGPQLDNMETSSRKQLLGFALGHCDDESIGELLHAWKDVDVCVQYEQLMTSTGTCPPNFSISGSSIVPLPTHTVQDIFDLRESYRPLDGHFQDNANKDAIHFESIKEMLSKIGKDLSKETGDDWDSFLRHNRKALSFSALELPWLLELSGKEEYGKKAIPGSKAPFRKHNVSIRSQALFSILGWLAGNDIAPTDDLITLLAKCTMEPPVSEDDDVLGCSFLLNLVDAFHGVEIIEELLKKREEYQEIYSIMNIGMTYSSLQNLHKECSSPEERRKLLLHKFHQKHAPFSSDDSDQIDKAQSTFWREWKTKLEDQRRLADQTRQLEQIIPGIDTARFLSGDIQYIKCVLFSFIDTVKFEKKHILKEAVNLADAYGLPRTEVLLRFFGSALVSDHWNNDDILAEISEYREDIVKCAKGVTDIIYSVVYPEIDGHNKQRLSYIYSILSACYLRLRNEEPAFTAHNCGYKHILEPFQFSKLLEQECSRVSFVSELNFKNIAGLHDLDFEHFNGEICKNIHESTVEALASMVHSLGNAYNDSKAEGLLSWQDVYKSYVSDILVSLKREVDAHPNGINSHELQNWLGKMELKYNICKKYVRALPEEDILHIIERYFMLCVPCHLTWNSQHESASKDCLLILLDFWIKVLDDFRGSETNEDSEEKFVCIDTERLSRCFKTFKRLLVEGEISTGQGWKTVSGYGKLYVGGGLTTDITGFLKAMILSGCKYELIAQVNSEAELDPSVSLGGKSKKMLDLYLNLTDAVLLELTNGSDEYHNLHHLLSSLSQLHSNHIEELKVIRCDVWSKLSAFSDNMQLESRTRVYALEMMQSLTGKNYRNLPVKLVADIDPWEAWDESCGTTTSSSADPENATSSITNTLVALKSTRLVAAISPDIRIDPEDLTTLDSAVSYFFRLCETASSKENIDVLRAVLEEWQELFPNRVEKEKTSESHEELNNWSADEWDEGWETFPETPVIKEEKQDVSNSVCPLHRCWMEIIKRLVKLSTMSSLIELLDQSSTNPNGALLDENETQSLYQLAAEIDCFLALKMLMLLPYEGPRYQCLHAVEAKLKKEGIQRHDDDFELLALVLSSGVVPIIATDPSLSKLLSYLCYLVGHLARSYQEDILKCSRTGTRRASRHWLAFFGRVLLPCFISELVKAGQHFLAGFIVSRWMHTPASLGVLDVAETSLRWFLEGQVRQSMFPGDDGGKPGLADVGLGGSLENTVSNLKGKLRDMLQYAISTLPVSTSN